MEGRTLLFSRREIGALALCALTPVILIFILGSAQDSSWAAPYVLLISYLSAILIAAPIVAALKYFGQNSLVAYILAGVVCGIIVSVALILTLVGIEPFLRARIAYISMSFFVVAFSAIAAVVYWVLARPDRAGIA